MKQLLLKRKKVLFVTLSQTHNNLFCDLSTTSFKYNTLVMQLKKRIKRFQLRKSYISFLSKRLRSYTIKNLLSFNINMDKKIKRISKRFIKIKGSKKTLQKLIYNKQHLISLINRYKYNYRLIINYRKPKIKLDLEFPFRMAKRKLKKTAILHRVLIESEFKSSNYYKMRRNALRVIRRNYQPYKYNLGKFGISRQLQKLKLDRKVQQMIMNNFYKRQRSFFFVFKNLLKIRNSNFFKILKKRKIKRVLSNGSIGFKGPKRQTPFAAEKLGLKIGRLVKRRNYKDYYIIIILRRRLTRMSRAFFRGFKRVRPKVHSVIPNFKIAHNRTRPRKSRRG